jgi:hypothetical protein
MCLYDSKIEEKNKIKRDMIGGQYNFNYQKLVTIVNRHVTITFMLRFHQNNV